MKYMFALLSILLIQAAFFTTTNAQERANTEAQTQYQQIKMLIKEGEQGEYIKYAEALFKLGSFTEKFQNELKENYRFHKEIDDLKGKILSFLKSRLTMLTISEKIDFADLDMNKVVKASNDATKDIATAMTKIEALDESSSLPNTRILLETMKKADISARVAVDAATEASTKLESLKRMDID